MRATKGRSLKTQTIELNEVDTCAVCTLRDQDIHGFACVLRYRFRAASTHRLVVHALARTLFAPAPGHVIWQRLPAMAERAFPFQRRACIDITRRYQFSATLRRQRFEPIGTLLASLRCAVHAAHVLRRAQGVVPRMATPALPTSFGRVGRHRSLRPITRRQRHQLLALERMF